VTSADLGDIREAVALALKAIPGLNEHPRYPKVINSPAAVVVRRETTYEPAFDVGADHTLAVRLFLSFADLAGAQGRLDDYCAADGVLSIRAAIDVDPTLGGVVDGCRVASAEDERITTYSGIDYLTVDLVLEVI
jgi:hypothetical protein